MLEYRRKFPLKFYNAAFILISLGGSTMQQKTLKRTLVSVSMLGIALSVNLYAQSTQPNTQQEAKNSNNSYFYFIVDFAVLSLCSPDIFRKK